LVIRSILVNLIDDQRLEIIRSISPYSMMKWVHSQ
jgi:hypothetical protein